ncbi:hypothetical protein [Rhizorhabdus phycosphaerae]|uniref:hypothetical protein n=1 Tax=Rhizorhabdus phycosphaerae TaxID=2711156 RepID=UPI0013E9F4CA|nr:hypothetical protein [Rhizorhabdus phycosphaerae]
MKKKLIIWWSLWRHARFAACNTICSIGCYAVGWHLSTAASAMPMARAGAMATAFAIGFALHDYRQALSRSEEKANRSFAAITKKLPLTGAVSQTRIETLTRRNTRMVDTATTVWQTGLLICATLIWGFGDLLNRFL